MAVIAFTSCSSSTKHVSGPATTTTVATSSGPLNVYAHTTPADMSPAVANARRLVYVPNSDDNTVDVIDPTTYAIVDHFAVPREDQHVTPSWDLKTLYVDSDLGDSLVPIDPTTGKPGARMHVVDPYNLYFTPDGRAAIVVAERLHRLDFRDPHTFALRKSVPVNCNGVDHADFSADGTQMLASCEFSGDLIHVDVTTMSVVGSLHVGGSPIDVKLSPDGSVYFVANQSRNGVSVIDAKSYSEMQFIPTGKGTHGAYLSRDLKDLYVSNRLDGSVSVIDVATRTVSATWTIPGGGSPDMGGVTADGTQLWLSGRYDSVVYVFDTHTGQLLHKIPVGRGPHGLCIFPQPGRYSLGHTGVYR
jgi:YVTN family beta-propeller protein